MKYLIHTLSLPFYKTSKSIILFLCSALFSFSLYAQHHAFKAGFDSQECEEILKVNLAFEDTIKDNKFIDYIEGYKFLYSSPSIGLDNMYHIWLRSDSTIIISLRGTTPNINSIMADLYCAMLPANGSIKLDSNKSFEYHLASDPRAAVHAGFLIGYAFIADHALESIQNLYKDGYRNFIITGHSQGGALCYYVSAWLMQLRKIGVFPNLGIKTYASAPPKMGNMYFAYDYDNAQLSNWSFSIVNADDPVPEIPFTTQQVVIDMNEPNPILNLMNRFDDLPFLKRVVLKGAFNNMKKNAEKSSESYQKYLGKYVGSAIHKALPGLELPDAVKTTYYVRPGVPITLVPTQNYYEYFKDSPAYYHHGLDQYRFLLREYYPGLSPYERVKK